MNARRLGFAATLSAFALAWLFWLGYPATPGVAQDKAPAKAATKFEYGTVMVYHGKHPQWTTAKDDMEGKSWADLAKKLNVPLKDQPDELKARVIVLDHLGSQGWELASFAPVDTARSYDLYIFKRVAP